ncbi:MAG: hypothetical protein RTU09_03985 [Candidatus Thorarchaeota archaeon]
MEELDKVVEALEVVERYEDYLFRKAWGRALLTIGIVIPLGFILAMNAQLLAQVLGLPVETVTLLSSIMTVIVAFGLIVLSFGSAQAAKSKKSTDSAPRGALHGVVIALIWFFTFLSIGFIPEAFAQVSLLWVAGVACILTYVVLKLTQGHEGYKEILFLGIILLIASLPLLAGSEHDISQYIALTIFSAAFVFCGLYVIATSSRKLSKIE